MYKILIVDDENLVRVAFRSMADYETLGFTVCATAGNGTEALQLCAQCNPDLIVTDIKMPKMDGIELIRTLRENQYQGQIVLISNYDDFDLVRQGMVLGAQDYLLKLTITTEEYTQMLLRTKAILDAQKAKRQQHEELLYETNCIAMQKKQQQWKTLLTKPDVVFHSSIRKELEQSRINLFQIRVLKYGEGEDAINENELELTDCAVTNIVTELLDSTTAVVGVLGQSNYYAVTFSKQEESVAQSFIAQKICSSLTQYLNIRVGVLYRAGIDSEAMLSHVLEQRERQYDQLFFAEQSLVQNMEHPPQCASWHPDIATLAAQFAQSVQIADTQKAMQIVEEMLQECAQQRPDSRHMKQKWNAWLSYVCEKLEAMDLTGFSDIPVRLGDALNFEKFSKILCDFANRLCAQASHDGMHAESEEVRHMIQYIHQHLDQKITLTELAQQINFNETYMCTVFRNEMGGSIISYINRLKMEKAGSQLLEGTRLLKEISSGLGFSDQFYFNKMFRKYYGVSSSAYRRLQKKIPISNDFPLGSVSEDAE